jgi:hypothetical protein
VDHDGRLYITELVDDITTVSEADRNDQFNTWAAALDARNDRTKAATGKPIEKRCIDFTKEGVFDFLNEGVERARQRVTVELLGPITEDVNGETALRFLRNPPDDANLMLGTEGDADSGSYFGPDGKRAQRRRRGQRTAPTRLGRSSAPRNRVLARVDGWWVQECLVAARSGGARALARRLRGNSVLAAVARARISPARRVVGASPRQATVGLAAGIDAARTRDRPGVFTLLSAVAHLTCSLEYLPSLDDVERLQNADDLRFFKALQRMSAAPLAALTDLDVLWLDGQFSDRDALRELIGLTNFKMGYAAKIPDPSFLPQNLTRFSMNLGSVTEIRALADLPSLQHLLFHKVHSINDLSPLADATGLRMLYLGYLNKVTHLFDLSALTELTDVTVSAMTNLVDLRPVLSAPSLTKLSVHQLSNLDHVSWHDTCTGWLAQGKPPFWE